MVAIDGTKIKANASRHKAMSFERMQQAEVELKAQIDALLDRAKSADLAKAAEPQVDIPAEIERGEVRLKAITEARQRIEKRQHDADIERGRSEGDECTSRDQDGKPAGGRFKREFGVPEPKAQDNFTDPDSRSMKRAGGGFDATYNAQTAVDDTAHIIVAAELTNNAADAGQLVPMLKAVKANTGEDPEQALADAGYRSEKNFQDLADLPGRLTDGAGGGLGARGQAMCRDRRQEESAHSCDGREDANRGRQGRLPKAPSGLPSRQTGGSRACSDSDNSGCEDCTACKTSSSSCAWH